MFFKIATTYKVDIIEEKIGCVSANFLITLQYRQIYRFFFRNLLEI